MAIRGILLSLLRALLTLVMALVFVQTAWAQVVELKLTASDDPEEFKAFGWSVSLSGDRALVGARSDRHPNKNSGSAYVFERQGDGSWLEVAKLTASDVSVFGGDFGYSVSLSQDLALVGARTDGGQGVYNGAAYVFERQQDGSWPEATKLTASDGAWGAQFGYSVSISGNRAIVGAPTDDVSGTDSGSAYVFERQENGTWLEVAKLISSHASFYDFLGGSVSIWADRAVMGARDDNVHGYESGMVYVFERQPDGSWIESDKLFASDIEENDHFGDVVSLSEDRVLVASDSGSNYGAVYVFEHNQLNDTWTETAKITASDGTAGDSFGHSVSDSGDYAIVGAPFDDDLGIGSGSAYVYRRQGDGSWVEVEKRTASDGAPFDWFGHSVSVSEDRIIVGAQGADAGGSQGGAAYVYENLIPVTNETLTDFRPNYRLSQPYPNPFNPQTQFSLEVAQAQQVHIEVFNTLSQRVGVLHDGLLPGRGTHRFTFEAGSLPSGVYLLRVTGETFVATRVMTLLK